MLIRENIKKKGETLLKNMTLATIDKIIEYFGGWANVRKRTLYFLSSGKIKT